MALPSPEAGHLEARTHAASSRPLFKAVLKRAATKKSRNDLIHAEEGEDRFADLCAVGESLWACGCRRSVHPTPSLSPRLPSFPTAHTPQVSPSRVCPPDSEKCSTLVLGFLPGASPWGGLHAQLLGVPFCSGLSRIHFSTLLAAGCSWLCRPVWTWSPWAYPQAGGCVCH